MGVSQWLTKVPEELMRQVQNPSQGLPLLEDPEGKRYLCRGVLVDGRWKWYIFGYIPELMVDQNNRPNPVLFGYIGGDRNALGTFSLRQVLEGMTKMAMTSEEIRKCGPPPGWRFV